MSKELSAEEIVNLIISNTASQFSEEWKPDNTKEELIGIVESFATKRVAEAKKEERKKVIGMINGNLDTIKKIIESETPLNHRKRQIE